MHCERAQKQISQVLSLAIPHWKVQKTNMKEVKANLESPMEQHQKYGQRTFISFADPAGLQGSCYLESTTVPSGRADRCTSWTWDFRVMSEPVTFASFALFSTILTSFASSIIASSSWPAEACQNHLVRMEPQELNFVNKTMFEIDEC